MFHVEHEKNDTVDNKSMFHVEHEKRKKLI